MKVCPSELDHFTECSLSGTTVQINPRLRIWSFNDRLALLRVGGLQGTEAQSLALLSLRRLDSVCTCMLKMTNQKGIKEPACQSCFALCLQLAHREIQSCGANKWALLEEEATQTVPAFVREYCSARPGP